MNQLKLERNLILTVALIQFVNILDFMIVMPLGPDFSKALGIPASSIGVIGGAYSFAAALVGIIAALFLDRFPRKTAMLFCLAGLAIATFLTVIVWDKNSMIAARLFAGAFGGPLTALSNAIIIDYIPEERRGRAIGKVAGGFAAASIFGVPFGLELASRISWHAPFIVTTILTLLIFIIAYRNLPYSEPKNRSLKFKTSVQKLANMLKSELALLTYFTFALIMIGGFMIIPNISAHIQLNIHYPRENLGILYLVGGSISFFTMRFAGVIVDKTSSTTGMLIFSSMLLFAIYVGFYNFHFGVPVIIIFVLFMVASTGRMICVQTVSSKVPSPSERAAFMSVQTTVMNLSSASGAMISSVVLSETSTALLGIEKIAMASMLMLLIVPIMISIIENKIKRKKAIAEVLDVA